MSNNTNTGLASAEFSEKIEYIDLIASGNPRVISETLTAVDAVEIPEHAPVVIDAAGIVTVAADGTAAHGIAMHAVAADASDRKVVVYRAGHFNSKAMAWPASYDTLAKKIAAFRGAPTPTNIFIS